MCCNYRSLIKTIVTSSFAKRVRVCMVPICHPVCHLVGRVFMILFMVVSPFFVGGGSCIVGGALGMNA